MVIYPEKYRDVIGLLMGIQKDYTSLEIYRLAEDLAVDIYHLTKSFPREELFGITSQIRRAAVSIPLNIAEGYGRFHFKDRSLFIYAARGSLMEVKSLVSICEKLRLIKADARIKLTDKINALGIKINNFINYLRSNK